MSPIRHLPVDVASWLRRQGFEVKRVKALRKLSHDLSSSLYMEVSISNHQGISVFLYRRRPFEVQVVGQPIQLPATASVADVSSAVERLHLGFPLVSSP